MGDPTDDAATVRAPGEGSITTTAVTATTASAAIAHGALPGMQYIGIGCDDGTATLPVFWVTFGASNMGAPAIAAVSGDARTMGPFQGVTSLKPRASETHYRVISTAAGHVRSYPNSHGSAK